MEKKYLEIFWLSIGGVLICIIFSIVLAVLLYKKVVSMGKCQLIFAVIALMLTIGLSGYMLCLCCKDYKYYSSGTCLEAVGTVVEFARVRQAEDGEMLYSMPIFLIEKTGEHIKLSVKAEKGKTYYLKYYPNTRICEISEHVAE